MKQNTLLSILALLLVLALACGGGNATAEKVGEVAQSQPEAQEEPKEEPQQQEQAEAAAEPTATPEPEPTAIPQTAFNVGDIVSIGDSNLVVLGWEDIAGNDFVKPDTGKKFIAVDLLIVNQSSSPAGISSVLQTSLKDDTGQKYDIDLMAATAAQSGTIDGELSPGERVRGKVTFQIPDNATGLQFVFDGNIFGTGKVFVNLGEQPVAVEPPAELAGETEQEVFNVGDIIEIGDFSLVVNEVSTLEGNEFAKPDEGNKFLNIDVTIENKTTNPAAISTALQMSIKDDTGQKYDIDLMAMAASGGTSPDGELAPGEKIRGQVGFQVPVDATGLVFVFDASIFGSGKAAVALP